MQLANHPGCHLTYCSNIHPGETWEETFRQLQDHLPELKKRLSPDKPFGVGLRLSAEAAEELIAPGAIKKFKAWLHREDLYVFTMNGFPYGNFHRQRVKDQVYAPDWRTEERVTYTSNLIKIISFLVPEGIDGGISTSPLSYKFWPENHRHQNREEIFRKSSVSLARLAHEMAEVKERTGKEIHLDIEPEPDCLLENSRETIDFFTNSLFPLGGKFLAGEFGYTAEKARQLLKKHIRVCYDTCHFAIEYEDPARAVQALRTSGIKIGKVQISAALKVQPAGTSEGQTAIAARLKKFDEPVYLHQVIERQKDGSLKQYRDLTEALPAIEKGEAEEWRIHFHVPVFIGDFDGVSSTQEDILKSFREFFPADDCRHFEIETYTWEVLPEGLKANILDSIEREYRWVLQNG